MLSRSARARRTTQPPTLVRPAFTLPLLALCLALWGCAQPPACAVAPAASLALTDEESGLYIHAAIDGRPVKLLLDTGSARSLLTSEAASSLGLHVEHLLDDTDVLIGYAIEGVGGRRHFDRAWTHRVDFGRLPLLGEGFPVVLSQHTGWDPSGDGIIGIDLLSRYDLDLDVGGGRLSLYDPGAMCTPAGAESLHVTRLLQDMEAAGPLVTVGLGGRRMTALIDTGAQRSFILAPSASLLRLGRVGRRIVVIGVGSGREHAVLVEAASLSVGGMRLPPLRMAVVDAPGLDRFDIILGEDLLRQVHVWISASGRSLTLASR